MFTGVTNYCLAYQYINTFLEMKPGPTPHAFLVRGKDKFIGNLKRFMFIRLWNMVIWYLLATSFKFSKSIGTFQRSGRFFRQLVCRQVVMFQFCSITCFAALS